MQYRRLQWPKSCNEGTFWSVFVVQSPSHSQKHFSLYFQHSPALKLVFACSAHYTNASQQEKQNSTLSTLCWSVDAVPTVENRLRCAHILWSVYVVKGASEKQPQGRFCVIFFRLPLIKVKRVQRFFPSPSPLLQSLIYKSSEARRTVLHTQKSMQHRVSILYISIFIYALEAENVGRNTLPSSAQYIEKTQPNVANLFSMLLRISPLFSGQFHLTPPRCRSMTYYRRILEKQKASDVSRSTYTILYALFEQLYISPFSTNVILFLGEKREEKYATATDTSLSRSGFSNTTQSTCIPLKKILTLLICLFAKYLGTKKNQFKQVAAKIDLSAFWTMMCRPLDVTNFLNALSMFPQNLTCSFFVFAKSNRLQDMFKLFQSCI